MKGGGKMKKPKILRKYIATHLWSIKHRSAAAKAASLGLRNRDG